MDGRGAAGPALLLELIEPSRWQRLQDSFTAVLSVPIRTITSSHDLLTTPSWPIGLPMEQAIRVLKIGEELDQLVPIANAPREISSMTTLLGVTYAVVPLHVTLEQVLGYFVVGPMVVGPREDELQFRQRVGEMGLDAQSLWPFILSLKLYTFSGIRSALTLIEEVGTSMLQLAYQAKQLSTILPPTSRVDQAVLTYHTDRILQSLLDAATLATKADGGSVMVYDARTEFLEIKTAQGLSDEVIATTRVKRGAGLAGAAMGSRTILLIDHQTTDERLKRLMHRPDLVSSLIAPLTSDPAQEPIGVLNLRSATPQKHFGNEEVELLRRLLEMACTVLGSLRAVFTQARTSSAS